MFSRLELRLVLRQLRRTPAFTLTVVALLALGLGANAAVFSVIEALLLAPLPYPAADQLVGVWQTNHGHRISLGGPDYVDWQQRNHTFAELCAAEGTDVADLVLGHTARRVGAKALSRGFFHMLGVRPELGRWPDLQEHTPGAAPVIVISHRLWAQQFGADPQVLGRSVSVDGMSARIIGVMPASFRFPDDDSINESIEIYVPLEIFGEPARTDRTAHNYRLMGRLKPGVSVEQANRDIQAVAAQVAREHPNEEHGLSSEVVSLRDQIAGDTRRPLLLLLAAAIAVLLISAANLATLNLARQVARRREMAVRMALGASLRRVLGGAVFESVILGLAGSALGLALSAFVLGALARFQQDLPQSAPVRLNAAVAAFTLLLALAAGLLFSLLPAWRQYRDTRAEELQVRTGISHQQLRLGRALVCVELAITVVLVLGGGVLFRSLQAALHRNPGFESKGRVVVSLALPQNYDHAQEMRFYDSLLERVRALPGVQSAGMVNYLPFSGNWSNSEFDIEGRPTPLSPQEAPYADYRAVTPGYFETMRIPVLQGRAINESDTATSLPVAVISAREAAKYFAGKSPVGKHIRIQSYDLQSPWRTIVGVVGDVLHKDLEDEAAPTHYVPVAQTTNAAFARQSYLVLKTDRAGEGLGRELRDIVQQIDYSVPVELHTLPELIDTTLSRRRLATYLTGAYALLALVVALVGLAGLISFVMANRTAEIGIRIALGASPARVQQQVFTDSLSLAGIGLVAGMAAGFLVLRLLRSEVFGISVYDPVTMISAPLLLLVTAVLAVLAPARRAARVDPMTVIRVE